MALQTTPLRTNRLLPLPASSIMQRSGVRLYLCPVTAKKSTHGKACGLSVARGLISRGSSSGLEEVTQGKPGAGRMARAAGYFNRENPARLTYAPSGNATVRLKTDTDFITTRILLFSFAARLSVQFVGCVRSVSTRPENAHVTS